MQQSFWRMRKNTTVALLLSLAYIATNCLPCACLLGALLFPQDVDAAVEGVDVVVHVATATPTSENALNKQLMDDVNVKGTQHVINACKKYGVHNMVYTSSASGRGQAGQSLRGRKQGGPVM